MVKKFKLNVSVIIDGIFLYNNVSINYERKSLLQITAYFSQDWDGWMQKMQDLFITWFVPNVIPILVTPHHIDVTVNASPMCYQLLHDIFVCVTIHDVRLIPHVITNTNTCIEIVLEVRSVKTNPKFRAADTRAFSSGDWAWYSRDPSAPYSGITVWHKASNLKNMCVSGFPALTYKWRQFDPLLWPTL